MLGIGLCHRRERVEILVWRRWCLLRRLGWRMGGVGGIGGSRWNCCSLLRRRFGCIGFGWARSWRLQRRFGVSTYPACGELVEWFLRTFGVSGELEFGLVEMFGAREEGTCGCTVPLCEIAALNKPSSRPP